LSVQVLQELIAQQQKGEALVLDQRLVSALRTVLSDESLDQAMVAEMLSLPSEAYLTEISEVADVEAIHRPRVCPQATGRSVVRRPVAALSG
jgi:aminopeptidase N